MKKFSLLFILASLLLVACGKENVSSDCDKIHLALLEKDSESLKSLLNPELAQFTFLDQDNNTCLHDRNLMSITDLLNNCAELNASIVCCACIETFPPISEIKVALDSLGVTVERIIDIRTPDQPPLIVTSIH